MVQQFSNTLLSTGMPVDGRVHFRSGCGGGRNGWRGLRMQVHKVNPQPGRCMHLKSAGRNFMCGDVREE